MTPATLRAPAVAQACRLIFLPEVKLAFEVEQQPAPGCQAITAERDKVTQSYDTTQRGTIALLAHACEGFYRLEPGHVVYVIFDTGHTRYRVERIDRYQVWPAGQVGAAMGSGSKFRRLSDGASLAWPGIVRRYFTGQDRVTLTTCIGRAGVPAWGRHFVVALPDRDGACQNISTGDP